MRAALLAIALWMVGCWPGQAAPPPGAVTATFNACPNGFNYGMVPELVGTATLVLSNRDDSNVLIEIDFSSAVATPRLVKDRTGPVLSLPTSELPAFAAMIARHDLLYVNINYHPNGDLLVLDGLTVNDTGSHC